MPHVSRLLIVDDDSLVLTLLSQLATSHFEQVLVETTDSPYQALERIKNNAYDVVISDVRMPGMNGLDLASRIGAISPGTSIVLISGALDHSDQVWSCDIFAYLQKPIDRDVFLRTVSDAIKKGRPQCLAGEEAKAVELALCSKVTTRTVYHDGRDWAIEHRDGNYRCVPFDAEEWQEGLPPGMTVDDLNLLLPAPVE